jgi:predicted transcriptional regulator
MKTFDDLEVRRPELARSYLELLKAQPGRPIALFAPRRVGKTFFLDQDLTPAARASGFTPVYADIWLHRSSPLSAINHALEEALDDATVPASAVGKAAKTPVKKVGALGAALELGDEPKRRALPEEPALRLDTLVARLVAARNQPVLLMLDEAQAVAESSEGASIMASLRAVLQKRKRDVLAVFTGSSQDALAAMMAASGGPMYQFAQLLNFPVLGDQYLNLLAQHFSRVHKGKRLDLAALQAAFVHLGYKPALMKDLVKELSAEGSTDVEATLRRMASDTNNVRGWKALLAPLSPFDRHLLVLIAQKKPPIGKNTLKELARTEGKAPTVAKVRAALERLRRVGILSGTGGDYLIEDPLLVDYLFANGPDRLL